MTPLIMFGYIAFTALMCGICAILAFVAGISWHMEHNRTREFRND